LFLKYLDGMEKEWEDEAGCADNGVKLIE